MTRGIFYSTMALLLLLPVVSYVVFYSDIIKIQNEEIVQTIVGNKLVSFSRSLDIDLKKALDIYSRRAVGNAVSYIDFNGSPIDNSNLRLKELILNNSIYGKAAFLNSSIYEWRDKMVARGKQLGFSVDINFTSVEFVPYDSFNIMLHSVVAANITVQDTHFYRIYNESTVVSVQDYTDPLYTINTNGLVKNVIKKSPFAVTNVTYLDNMTLKRLYISSENGASFFDRLEGRLLASDTYKALSPLTIGLESTVYQPDLLSFGITPKTTQTYVDYLYFNNSAITGYPVNDSSISWLKIDPPHASLYGVSLIT